MRRDAGAGEASQLTEQARFGARPPTQAPSRESSGGARELNKPMVGRGCRPLRLHEIYSASRGEPARIILAKFVRGDRCEQGQLRQREHADRSYAAKEKFSVRG
jgi:hypothetical protein